MEETKITFGDIAKMLKKRIWWVVAVVLIVTIVASCLMAFVVNKGKQEYSLTFGYEYPNSEDNVYPNGEKFNVESIVYVGNLLAVKQSNAKFSKVDVESLTGNISIAPEQKVVGEGNNKKTEPTGNYVIKAKSNCFSDVKQAKEFLMALVDYAMKEVKENLNKIDYSMNFASYDYATTYEEKLSALDSQYKGLVKYYDDIIEKGKNANFIYNKQTISQLKEELKGSIASMLSYLRNDLNVNKYITSENKVEEVLAKNKAFEKEKENNENIIKSLKTEMNEIIDKLGSVSTTQISESLAPFTERISALTERNATIDNELKTSYTSLGYTFDGTKWVAPSEISIPPHAEFSANLEKTKEALIVKTETCQNAISRFYEENTKVEYPTGNVVVVNNGRSVVLVAVISIVLSLIVVSLIICMVDYPKYKKEKLSGEQ